MNVSNRGLNADFLRKLSSDPMHKICNGFSGFHRLNIALKKISSSKSFLRKHKGKIHENEFDVILESGWWLCRYYQQLTKN